MTNTVARRRFLQGISAAAVIGFDPVRRSWVTEASASTAGLVSLPHLDGTLVTDSASLAKAGADFGNIVHRTPRAVLRPGSVNDIVVMVRYALQYRLQIAMRGQGHSTHGQAQVGAGIVIDSSTLNQVHTVGSDYADVGPGARWREVIAATLPRGLTPPTLPNYLDLTIGGQTTVGGIGGAGHRHGAVVDNVLELDVVTGTGQLRRCSARENAALFNAVRGGLGQFGIIVRARIKLVPAKPLVRLYSLTYNDRASIIEDATTVALDERFDHVEGQFDPDATGRYTSATLLAAAFFNPGAPPRDADLLSGLTPTATAIQDMPYEAFLKRIDPIIDMMKAVGAFALPHPWFDAFLPESTMVDFLDEVIPTIDISYTGQGPVIFYPLRRSKVRTPFLAVPQADEVFFLFDILANAPPDPVVVAQMLARNAAWHARARALGGKQYNIGSYELDREGWKTYFSPHWPAVVLAKLAYDPTNILTPGQGIFPAGCVI